MPQQQTLLGERYEVFEAIGRGGMATVYRGTDRVLGRAVAVKVLGPQYASDESFVARFRREARAAARLTHPNVVAVFDTGSDDGTHYIVMEHVDGRTLAGILADDGPLDPARAAEVAQGVCAALAFAHSRDIVHRDVKPANVMVTAAGRVKVMDFGIARAATDDTLTRTAMVLGTANYLSPEQAEGKRVDARSDVYSLGVVLYEALAGQPPFTAPNPVAVAAKHVQEAPEPPSRIRPGIPPALEAVVMRALEKDPRARFQSAQEMGAALEAARLSPTEPLPRTAVLSPPPTEPMQTGRHRRPRRWLPFAAVISGLIVLGAILAAVFGMGGSQPLASHHGSSGPSAPASSPSPSPPPPQQPTVSQAAAAFSSLVTRGVAAGQIDPGAGNDLNHGIQDLLNTLGSGKTEDVAHKLSDLDKKLTDDIDHGQISGSYAPMIESAFRRLVTAIGVAPAEGGGHD